jgi:hypothetical protein
VSSEISSGPHYRKHAPGSGVPAELLRLPASTDPTHHLSDQLLTSGLTATLGFGSFCPTTFGSSQSALSALGPTSQLSRETGPSETSAHVADRVRYQAASGAVVAEWIYV